MTRRVRKEVRIGPKGARKEKIPKPFLFLIYNRGVCFSDPRAKYGNIPLMFVCDCPRKRIL